jgi:hypothetical protein
MKQFSRTCVLAPQKRYNAVLDMVAKAGFAPHIARIDKRRYSTVSRIHQLTSDRT